MDDVSIYKESSNDGDKRTRLQEANKATEFKEGGLAGWGTVVGAFIVQFCGFGYTTSYGVYQDFYTRTYITNQPPSTIAWIGSINAFLVIAGGLAVGRLYDRGYFYHLLYGGTIISSFSLFMLSCAKQDQFYQIFLSQGLGLGIGAGMVYVPSLAIVSHHFQQRRSLVMTIVASGSSLGSVVHPIMLNHTINGSLGFTNGVRASAGMISGLSFISCLLMRTRLPPAQNPANLLDSLKKFGRDKAYVVTVSGSFLFLLSYYFPLFYLQLDAVSHGLNEMLAFYSLVILSFSSFIGRLCCGLFVQSIGVPNMIVISLGSCTAVIFGMIGLKTAASVIILAIIYGFFSGAYIALIAPLLSILADDVSEIGARIGVAFAFAGIGVLIGPPIDGALLDHNFSWWKPAVFSGSVSSAGFGLLLFMLFILRSRKLKRQVAMMTGVP